MTRPLNPTNQSDGYTAQSYPAGMQYPAITEFGAYVSGDEDGLVAPSGKVTHDQMACLKEFAPEKAPAKTRKAKS
jgi:hypothetical protein